jgi:stress responsive alpha/beta barrel protein
MIVHAVLFRPKANVTGSARQAMFDALTVAATEIPSVRRFHIGKRVTHGAGYERMMTADFPFAALVEFDDLAGLQAYLQHPMHEKLGELFYALLDVGLVYDYEVFEPALGFSLQGLER